IATDMTEALTDEQKALTLVSKMSCHSSSFIRINKLSRVIPALLTKISISPNSVLIALITDSIDASSVTFSAKPFPLEPKYSLMACAPFSVVAVPIKAAQKRLDYVGYYPAQSATRIESPKSDIECHLSFDFD
ncbi:hypothetical protein GASC598P17_000130, partial [Gilliamella apis SCGC AB-598-P17]